MSAHKVHQGCTPESLNVKNNYGLLMAAVVMQARIDAEEVGRNREYYKSKRIRKKHPVDRCPYDEIVLSYDGLKWWIEEPGILEAFVESWQNEISAESVREKLREVLG